MRQSSVSRRLFLSAAGAAALTVPTLPSWGRVLYSPLGAITALAISPDSARLAFAQGWRIAILNLRTGKVFPLPSPHQGVVNSLYFSAHGELLGSGGADGTVAVWHDGKIISRWNVGGHVTSVAVSPDGSTVAGFWDGRLAFPTTVPARTVQGHLFGKVRLHLAPDKDIVVSSGDDQTVSLWSLRTAEKAGSLRAPGLGIKAHRGRASAIFLSADWVLTGGVPARQVPALALWDVPSRAMLQTYTLPPRRHLLQGEGTEYLSGSTDGRTVVYLPLVHANIFSIFDVESWAQKAEVSLNDTVFVHAMVAPNGRFCAVATSSGTVYFFDLAAGRPVVAFAQDYDAYTVHVPDAGGRIVIAKNADAALAEALSRVTVPR
jgi:WD40 repeat protein